MAKRGQNEGTIFLRSDGRWAAVVNLGWQDGKRRRKCFYGATRAEVQEKLIEALRDRQLGLPVIVERQTVAQFLQTWLDGIAKPSVRPKTFDSYSWIIRHHLVPGLGRVALVKLSPQEIQAFLNRKLESGLKPRTVQHIHATLRAALGQAEKWGLVPRNIATLVKSPHVAQPEIQPFTPEDARAFLEGVRGDRLEALYSVAIALGVSQGEALGLPWSDVDLDAGILTVRHTLQRLDGKLRLVEETKRHRRRRSIRLPQVSVAALWAHQVRQEQEHILAGDRWQETGFVFTTTIGTPLDGPTVTHRFQRILKAAGLRLLRFHDLRHTCATLLLAQGVHPRLVMEILGHSQISVTLNTYSHVIPAMQREVAGKMDEILHPVAVNVAVKAETARPN